jgi:hypothetical protein
LSLFAFSELFSHDDLALVAIHSTASSNDIAANTADSFFAYIVPFVLTKTEEVDFPFLLAFLTPSSHEKSKRKISTHRDVADKRSDEFPTTQATQRLSAVMRSFPQPPSF